MFKIMLRQVSEKMPKVIIGTGIITPDCETLDEAKHIAESYLLTSKSTYQIREYNDDRYINIISFDEQDTGQLVYASIADN